MKRKSGNYRERKKLIRKIYPKTDKKGNERSIIIPVEIFLRPIFRIHYDKLRKVQKNENGKKK